MAWTLQWRHNEHDGIPDHQPHNCLLNRLFRRRSKKKSKLCVTGLFAGNSPVTSEFPTQRASNVENVSIRWRHHEILQCWMFFHRANWYMRHPIVCPWGWAMRVSDVSSKNDLCSALKSESCHDANFVITGSTGGCPHDNLRCCL